MCFLASPKMPVNEALQNTSEQDMIMIPVSKGRNKMQKY